MTENAKMWCVLIPCSGTEIWAVPQKCLGEIVTVPAESDQPPRELTWRGHAVPVVDLGGGDGPAWRDASRGAGLVAIFLGLKGEGCAYWGVAVRGGGLRVVDLAAEDIDDLPEQAGEHATAAFDFRGVLCQVPDLDEFQKQIAVNQ
jgi:hypothetical protein